MINLDVPINHNISNLKAGDVVYLSGNILTARDQAHKRILEEGSPYDLEGAAIFHAGPIIKNEGTEEKPDYKMVAIGPTTSMRMNPYQSDVIDKGVKVVVGKGGMDESVLNALIRNNAVYLVATGGCAALYVDAIEKIENVEWLDLGMPEAIWNLKINSFGPLIVGMDSNGNSLYK
ncbi:MAG: FumA C-terminus/TtdB family hydratase beta subunit [Methanobacteriaceae archaeon]|jgi:fumarate hydratase subunit beta|nr:FumA C-terminus/TtdB family hydratase beta subunit [Methanobacteriaceae archaeon]